MTTKDAPRQLVSVTFRCPADLVRAVDQAAAHGAARLALPVDRSALIRRTLAQALATGTVRAAQPLGLADPVFPTT